MTDHVLVHVPGLGLLKLTIEAFNEALAAGQVLQTPVAPRDTEEPLIDADEIAKQLSIPASWIESAARQGRIPHIQFGRWRRYRRGDVKTIMAVRSGVTEKR